MDQAATFAEATPVATDTTLRPLVTAAEMFPELETLVLNAKQEILLSFRVFDARTRLHSDEAKDLGLNTWADLIAHVSTKGVSIRMLLSDFDPVFTADLHRDAWASASRFASRTADHANTEIICAMHDCAPAPLWEYAFSLPVRSRLAQMRGQPHEKLTSQQLRAIQGDYHLRPVTLHQKFAVIDRKHAIIGGIDVDDRRYDDDTHDQRPEDTWHDVSMRVSGPITDHIRAHFADCWARARDRCGTTFSEETTEVQDPQTPTIDDGPRLLRTVSRRGTGAARFGPVTEVKEHESAHLEAFAKAKRSIYIETQFMRHLPLAHALAKRAKEEPDLQLIMVIPTEPERVIFGRDNGMTARHAQALQIQCLNKLRHAFGDRLAILSPAQPRPAPDGTPLPVEGSGIIYLHSKVTLVDDATAIVGSANLNGRSLLWDTEASVQFDDAKAIDNLRERLARKWLCDNAGNITQAETWMTAAETAASRPPAERETMVLPYPEQRNRRFARYVPILPSAMF